MKRLLAVLTVILVLAGWATNDRGAPSAGTSDSHIYLGNFNAAHPRDVYLDSLRSLPGNRIQGTLDQEDADGTHMRIVIDCTRHSESGGRIWYTRNAKLEHAVEVLARFGGGWKISAPAPIKPGSEVAAMEAVAIKRGYCSAGKETQPAAPAAAQKSMHHLEQCTRWGYIDANGRWGTSNTCKRPVEIHFMTEENQRAEVQVLKPGEIFDTGLTRTQIMAGWWMFTTCPVGYASSVPFAPNDRDALMASKYRCIATAKPAAPAVAQKSMHHLEQCTRWGYIDANGRWGTSNTCKRSVEIHFMTEENQRAEVQVLKPGEIFDTGLTRAQIMAGWWMFTTCPVGYASSVPFAPNDRDALMASKYRCIATAK